MKKTILFFFISWCKTMTVNHGWNLRYDLRYLILLVQDVIVGDRTIDVHIRKLREKIGDLYFKTWS